MSGTKDEPTGDRDLQPEIPEVPGMGPRAVGHTREGQGGAFQKRCAACGHEHTLETWRVLPLVGVQLFEYGEDEVPAFVLFEQRNCPCGSTLSRPLEREDPALYDLLAETERRRLDLAAGRR